MSALPLKLFYSERQPLSLPDGNRFPASKYSLLLEHLRSPEYAGRFELVQADPASDDQLMLVHTADYVRRLTGGQMSEKEMRRIGFPWTEGLVERARRSVGSTISACLTALEQGASANLGGGTHHAFPDHGEGYCVFNDVAVASRLLLEEHRLERIIVIDCDVHQGNGTAAIFAGDSRVFTFSIHGSKNFPFHKQPGDLDIALPDGCEDDSYLSALAAGLDKSMSGFPAQLAVYIAGADPFSGDRLGRLALTREGLTRRDRLVFEYCSRLGIPVAVVMGGGYARDIRDIVDINLQTLVVAAFFSQEIRDRLAE